MTGHLWICGNFTREARAKIAAGALVWMVHRTDWRSTVLIIAATNADSIDLSSMQVVQYYRWYRHRTSSKWRMETQMARATETTPHPISTILGKEPHWRIHLKKDVVHMLKPSAFFVPLVEISRSTTTTRAARLLVDLNVDLVISSYQQLSRHASMTKSKR